MNKWWMVVLVFLLSCANNRKNIARLSTVAKNPIDTTIQNRSVRNCLKLIDSVDGQAIDTLVREIDNTKTSIELMEFIQYFSAGFAIDSTTFPQDKITVSFLVDTFGNVRDVCLSEHYFKDSISTIERDFLIAFEKIKAKVSIDPAIKKGRKIPSIFELRLRWCYDFEE